MIVWENEGWQVYDNQCLVPDKYTGLQVRYQLRRFDGRKWKPVRKLKFEEVIELAEVLADAFKGDGKTS